MNNPTAAEMTEEQRWAGPGGERWLANAARFEASLRPIADALINRAKIIPGEHIIDIGCGAGGTSLMIADLVAPTGSVTGLDISPVLIDEATRRAASTHPKSPTRFLLGDAAKATAPTPPADLVFSRFGIMFFTDPYPAFANIRTFLRADNTPGRLAFACWAPLPENPWMNEMRTVLSHHIELPKLPPRTPGPFAFADPDYQRDILQKAGFRAIDIHPWKTTMHVGGPNSTPASAAEFLLHSTSLIQRLGELPPDTQQKVQTELQDRYQTYSTPTGVRTPASVWLTTASR